MTPVQVDEIREIIALMEEQISMFEEATKRLGEIIND